MTQKRFFVLQNRLPHNQLSIHLRPMSVLMWLLNKTITIPIIPINCLPPPEKPREESVSQSVNQSVTLHSKFSIDMETQRVNSFPAAGAFVKLRNHIASPLPLPLHSKPSP